MSLVADLFETEEIRCEKMGYAMSGTAVGVLSKLIFQVDFNLIRIIKILI